MIMTYKIGDRIEYEDGDDVPADLQEWLDKNDAHVERTPGDDGKSYFLILSNSEPYYVQNRIWYLKSLLSGSDYKAIKYAEGMLTEEEYAPTRAQRQAWRDEINELEGNEE